MSRPSSYAIANSPSVPMNAKDHKNQARSCAILGRLVLLFSAASRDHGAHVSVGEKQRINLARAFLKDAPILLMDEPTSALPRVCCAALRAAPSALESGRDPVERERQHTTGVRDP